MQRLLLIDGQGGQLERITKLTIYGATSAQDVARLLALTPAIEKLEIQINYNYKPDNFEADLKRAILSLKSLTRLTVKRDPLNRQAPDWLDAVIQEASGCLTIDFSIVTDDDELYEWDKRTIVFF